MNCCHFLKPSVRDPRSSHLDLFTQLVAFHHPNTQTITLTTKGALCTKLTVQQPLWVWNAAWILSVALLPPSGFYSSSLHVKDSTAVFSSFSLDDVERRLASKASYRSPYPKTTPKTKAAFISSHFPYSAAAVSGLSYFKVALLHLQSQFWHLVVLLSF